VQRKAARPASPSAAKVTRCGSIAPRPAAPCGGPAFRGGAGASGRRSPLKSTGQGWFEGAEFEEGHDRLQAGQIIARPRPPQRRWVAEKTIWRCAIAAAPVRGRRHRRLLGRPRGTRRGFLRGAVQRPSPKKSFASEPILSGRPRTASRVADRAIAPSRNRKWKPPRLDGGGVPQRCSRKGARVLCGRSNGVVVDSSAQASGGMDVSADLSSGGFHPHPGGISPSWT